MKNVMPRYFVLLNHLLQAGAIEDPSQFKFRRPSYYEFDGFSLIGMDPYDMEAIENILDEVEGYKMVIKDNEVPATLLLGSLGHLICGLSDERMTRALEDRENMGQILLPIVAGLKSCPNEDILKIFALQVSS